MHYNIMWKTVIFIFSYFIMSIKGNILDMRTTRYYLGHIVPNPAFPGPVIEPAIKVQSRLECGALCRARSECLGYSYENNDCNLYIEVLYLEDFSDDPVHQLIHFDNSRVSHPYECPQGAFPISDVGEVRLAILGHGPWQWRPGRQISLRLEPQEGACNGIFINLYEYEYYYETDFTADYNGVRQHQACPGFKLVDYDVAGSNVVDSRQKLVLGSDLGLFHLHIEVDRLQSSGGTGYDPANMAMWGYQLEFMSNINGKLLYTLNIPQYTFGRHLSSRTIGVYDSDTRTFSCNIDL